MIRGDFLKKSMAAAALLLSAGLVFSSCGKDIGSSSSDSSQTDSMTVSSPAASGSVTETTALTSITPAETIITVPEEAGIPDVSTSKYGYYLLNADEKSAYDQIAEGIRNFQPSVTLKRELKKDAVEKIIDLVLLEETDLYYAKAGELTFNKLTDIVSYISFNYRFTATEVQQLNAASNKRMQEILDMIPEGSTEIAKIKIFHDQIVLNCTYDENYNYSGTPYGALVAGQAVCEGYARAFAMLCNKVGIENLFAIGSYDGIEHKWNMVKLDGNWYNIDLTWDDPPRDGDGEPNPDYYIQYNYFMYKTGQSGTSLVLDESLFALPATESGFYNYFVYYGYHAKSYEEAKQILSKQLDNALKNNRKFIRIKFSSSALYNEACARLLDSDMEIFSKDVYPFSKVSRYWVYRDPQLNIIQLEIVQLRTEPEIEGMPD